MKTPKFRAFDKDQNKMSYVVSVYSENDGSSWWSADHINPETGDTIYSFDEKAGVLMGFVGKVDKNEKEIFGGDIVKMVFDDCLFEIIFDIKHECIMKSIEKGKKKYKIGSAINLEIIGNKYENPQLMLTSNA